MSVENDIEMKENEIDSDDEPVLVKKKGPGSKKKNKAVMKSKPKPKAKKKDLKRKREPTSKSVKSNSKPKVSVVKKEKVKKELTDVKKLELAMQAFKWWEHERPLGDLEAWRNLEQNGVMFPPSYNPLPNDVFLRSALTRDKIELTLEQEEVAVLFAAIPLDGPQLGADDKNMVETFENNFFNDFKSLFGKTDKHKVKKFKDLDFNLIRHYLNAEKEKKKDKTKEEKEIIKDGKEKDKLKYTFAFVDGNLQKVGNVMVEPPGLFRGRGAHPKTGTLKTRVFPHQITLNLGVDEPVPKCPLPGHCWGELVHKTTVTWLAHWKENVMDSSKYVWLAASSSFKGKSDREKFEKARRLKNCIGEIRKSYEKDLFKKDDPKVQQRGCAMWVIDRLALRVGNEKDDDEADTVGCCSLRVEHVVLKQEDGEDGSRELELDFLGKDSMRHHQVYDLGETNISRQVFKVLEESCKGKEPNSQVFDKLEVTQLNDHLKSLMPGLSAKVFRTFNASVTLEQQLDLQSQKELQNLSVQEKMIFYNAANRQVAILCNHQKTVTKSTEKGLDKLSETVSLLKKQKKDLQQMLKARKAEQDVTLKVVKDEDTREEKTKKNHQFTKQPTVAQVEKRIEMWIKKIKTQELNLQNKNDNKTVALGTSKINYMDPRISVAWAKKHEVPIEKIFSQTLRDKFPWAMSESTEFRF